MSGDKYQLSKEEWGAVVDLVSGAPITLTLSQWDRVKKFWVDTVNQTAGKNKELIDTRILVTGDPASGKTFLMKYLNGEEYDPGWEGIGESMHTETTRATFSHPYSVIRVVRGQL